MNPKFAILLDSLWKAYLDIADAGLLWDPERASSSEGCIVLQQILFRDWSESQAIGANVKLLELWKEFPAEQGNQWRSPDIFSVRLFVEVAAIKGPTAARARLYGLR